MSDEDIALSTRDKIRVGRLIDKERARQFAKGWTTAHDDEHDEHHFGDLIETRLWRMEDGGADDAEECMIQIAALATAYIEKCERARRVHA